MNITPAPVMDLAARVVPNGVTVLGVDRFGMDYRNAGGRQRVALEPDSDTVYR